MPAPVPVQLLCFSVGLAFSVPVGWWAYHVGYAHAPRRVIDIDGKRREWNQTAQLENNFKAPDVVKLKLPDYTEVAPGHYVRFSWRKLSRTQWKALLETTAEGKLCGAGKPYTNAELTALRDLLIARGCAEWRSPGYPQQGWKLSRAMWRAVVRHTGGALPHRNGTNTKAYAFSRESTYVRTEKE